MSGMCTTVQWVGVSHGATEQLDGTSGSDSERRRRAVSAPLSGVVADPDIERFGPESSPPVGGHRDLPAGGQPLGNVGGYREWSSAPIMRTPSPGGRGRSVDRRRRAFWGTCRSPACRPARRRLTCPRVIEALERRATCLATIARDDLVTSRTHRHGPVRSATTLCRVRSHRR